MAGVLRDVEMTGLSNIESISELQELYRSGAATVESVVESCLGRIEAMDRGEDGLNAMVTVSTTAIEQARRLDQDLAAGRDLGPLFGVPMVIKDNIDVEGLPTSGGSAALASLMPASDAPVVERVRAAGAVILGKSNMSEFAFGTYDTESSVVEGPTRNAHVAGYASGGSSGGTAVAIAAGYCLAGIGTDTGCSVRAPASINELVGIRPTQDSIDMSGIMPMNADWDTVGPLARNVDDLAVLLGVMRGSPSSSQDANLDRSQMRVGVVRAFTDPDDTDAEVLALFESCLARMIDSGIDVVDPVDVAPFAVPFAAGDWYLRFRADLDGYLAGLGDRAPHPTLASILATGQVHPRYEDRLRSLEQWPHDVDDHPRRQEMDRIHSQYVNGLGNLVDEHDLDAFVFPTFRYPPVRNGSVPWNQLGEIEPVGSNNYIASLTGFPALNVPMSRTAAGLPVGVQILGQPNSEHRLLHLASQFETS